MSEVVTKTLAEIYFQQGHLKQAYEIFKKLAEKDPSDAEVQMRLYELSEKFRSPALPAGASCFSPAERISILKGWLANIRKRRGV
jgi:tetratricopeptide (TPR) repeat protein